MSETSPTQTGPESNDEQQLEAVIADYIRACESGTPPNRREIMERHPDLADELRQFFGQHDRMNQMAEPMRDFGDSVTHIVGPGQRLSYVGNYELLEEVARGGMGVVYRARQTTLGRIVAVKMIIKGRLASEQDVQRFLIEAREAGGLQHPNIVAIHEVGQHEGWHYFSMDFVRGRDLSSILRENLLSAKQAATYVRQMAEAIHYAHHQGTLHRDLKPSNILIDEHDQVRITDFGLAMRVDGDSDLTQTGQILGTPSYMPPEQAQGKRSLIGPASDVYSLGAILYECLTGRAPFRADSVIKTIEQVIHAEAASPRLLNPGIPRDLETICLKCLQKEPYRRYGTAQLLAEELQRFLEGRPIQARPIRLVERTWRWSRRNGIVAGLIGSVVLSLIIGMSVSIYFAIESGQRAYENSQLARKAQDARRDAVAGEKLATKRLYRSLVAQARANRLSHRIGQRFQSLDVLTEASRLAHEMSLPEEDFVELRNEAIACMALVDIRTEKQWDGWPQGSLHVDFDSALERYARTDREANVSVRRVLDDAELWRLEGLGPGEAWPNLSADGQFLVVWNNGRFKLWSLAGPEPILLYAGLGDPHFAADNRRLAAVQQGRVALFELPSGKLIKEFPDAGARGIAFHPQLNQLAVSSPTEVRILDIDTGNVLAQLPQDGCWHLAWHPWNLAWNPDGNTLAVVGSDSNIYVWDVTACKLSAALKGHSEGTTVAFNRTGDMLASHGWGQPLRLWNPQTAELLFQAPIEMTSSHFSPDGHQLAVDQVAGGQLRILEVADASSYYRTMIRDPVLGVGEYRSAAMSPNGRLLASGMDGGVALWDFHGGKPITFLPTAGKMGTVRFEPSGALLASGHIGLVRWTIDIDPANPEKVRVGPQQQLQHSGSSVDMGMSRDGRTVAQAMIWGGMVWQTHSADPPLKLIHDDARFIDVSPNGRWVATGSHWHTKVKIWDTTTSIPAHELPVEGSSQVVFSSDSRRLATTYDGIRLWSVETGQEMQHVGDGRRAIAFSPDDSILAVATTSGIIRLVNPDTGRDYAQLEDPHQHRTAHAAFSSDGSQLAVTALEDHAIHVWNLRAIRARLAEMKLDWELPTYRPSDSHQPLRLDIADPSASLHSASDSNENPRIDPQLPATRLGPPFDAVLASLKDRVMFDVGLRDWPQWGGSRQRNNTPSGKNIPTTWDVKSGKNIKWSAKLGSETYGNPCIANGKLFIGTNNGNGYLQRYPATVDLGVMLCFEKATGKFLWQYSSSKLATGRAQDWPDQGMPSTPVADGNRVWATTNRGEIVCLDAEGFRDNENDGPFRDEPNENHDEADIIWRFDMIKELGVSPHNMSNCSVLMVDGLLFACTSNGVDESHFNLPSPDAPSFFAMDRDTGKILWTDNSPGGNILHGQWASPSYDVFDGQPQVLFPGGDGWLYSFDPNGDGLGNSKLLWKFDCNPKKSFYTITRATRNQIFGYACIYDGLVYIAVGEDPEHGDGQGHLWCIDPTKRGDVSPTIVYNSENPDKPIAHKRLQALDEKAGDFERANPNSAAVWHYIGEDPKVFETTMHRTMGTVAIRNDLLYVLDFSGLFHCVNAKSGKAHWTYDMFAESWGSPLIVEDHVYVCDTDGDVAIFHHSAEPWFSTSIWARPAEINMENSIVSTPVVANNVLYIVTRNMLYAIEGGK